MLDQIFQDIPRETILENVPHPWIFSMLSAVNSETANMGDPVTLNARSTVAELIEKISHLAPAAQAHVVERAFHQYSNSTRGSAGLHESIREIEETRTKHKVISIAIYTMLGLLAFIVVSTVVIAMLGIAADIDEKLGSTIFQTLLELINILYSS